MVIICPWCKKEHHIDEKKIPENATAARCTACQKKILLRTGEPQLVDSGGTAPEKKSSSVRRIAVSLSKGGVGKTTTAVNLAVGLTLAGKKVLLVDTDTQGQASFMLGVKPKTGLTELVTGELTPEETIYRVREKLSLLAGGRSLAGLKRLISRKDFGGEMTMSEALTPLENQFDYVIMDTSPGWDVLTVNAFFYINEVLVPVSLEAMTLQGLTEFLTSISAIKKYRQELDIKYVLPTFFDKRLKKSEVILEKLREIYGTKLCTPIRTNVRVSEAPASGKSLFEFAPGSPGAEDYRELIRKIVGDDKLFK
ncbi:MAG TPA: AAA family ATPase [Deltaproteobacteria bacterium]|nr:AAA family ATPase [Deltaproteobacteria bacterium]HIJ40330.1 AAA family ATPase [Deltaproteobacteria bacterium]HIJ41740.1 AAA family ATPase [Deltaproteobacteria bacterium]